MVVRNLLTCFGGVSICMCHFWTGTCSVILSNMLLKSNHTFNFMCFVCFSKSSHCIQSLLRGSCNFELLYEKPTCANFFQIELKVVWLPILIKQLPLMLALTEKNITITKAYLDNSHKTVGDICTQVQDRFLHINCCCWRKWPLMYQINATISQCN